MSYYFTLDNVKIVNMQIRVKFVSQNLSGITHSWDLI